MAQLSNLSKSQLETRINETQAELSRRRAISKGPRHPQNTEKHNPHLMMLTSNNFYQKPKLSPKMIVPKRQHEERLRQGGAKIQIY